MTYQRLDQSFLEENDYEFLEEIGTGSFGKVCLIYSYQYKQKFALKIIPIKVFDENEIKSLASIDCPFITRLYQYMIMKDVVYLVMEFVPNSLHKMLQEKGAIEESKCISIARQLLTGIKTCHEHNISHGDIKLSNVLVDVYGRPKLCDFGMASVSETKRFFNFQFRGSFPYVSPEILLKRPYDPLKADICAFGVLLYIMLTAKCPWSGKDANTLTSNIFAGNVNIDLITNPDLANVIKMCLSIDPKKRPTADELTNMYIFTDSHLPQLTNGFTMMRNKQTNLSKSLNLSTFGRSFPRLCSASLSRLNLTDINQ
ncbi:CAMK family protein kinase [Trichomonas vaginalis G3]|uniref:CAMK family protein kinase n=1 Tax=Trichomonas vaginalis (strain ATCC PRA-98 / G3) TaxID=412133 RepID=A2EM14_TRIV3|nr:protein serine/threonine kinase protein [Trichomonas vaginalis G3]EAY06273.1 CAMK family protein kinase [Trichomonas vaginalis G3]KAI5503351.1 protein serine/threonine kinase protein [Trichomonas vaginalis G3]|eukprot:XP_001318496.1 CAMK family protein kinase [Trichomonas vaginalis G3]